jgi:crotonobetainyl-CoA:carnitine CoA-transferase CaiB-like acyl-CoA transferase
MLLADFGADVIKIEPPEGDALRGWPPLSDGFSENFASINRGKRSLALDLKNPSRSRRRAALALDADVLVENNRPGAMQRLGLGWDWFAERKPSLVYCSISAFGQDGPRGGEGGFDLTVQAAAGVMSVTGEPDGAPVKAGVPLADFAVRPVRGLRIASLLARVRAGGPGGHIDVPMFGATLAIAALQTSEYFGTGRNPVKLGSAHPRNAPYQAYRAADGWFAIAAGNNKLWQSVCDVVGTPGLLDDVRFTTPTLRARHQRELKDAARPALRATQPAHWLAAFASAGVPCAPINGYAEALADPQARHLQLVRDQVLPGGHRHAHRGLPGAPGRPADPGRHRRAGAGQRQRAMDTPYPGGFMTDRVAPLRQFVTAMTERVARTTDERTLLAEGRWTWPACWPSDDWLPDAFATPRPTATRSTCCTRSAGTLLGGQLRLGPGPAHAGARPHRVGPGRRAARGRALRRVQARPGPAGGHRPPHVMQRAASKPCRPPWATGTA